MFLVYPSPNLNCQFLIGVGASIVKTIVIKQRMKNNIVILKVRVLIKIEVVGVVGFEPTGCFKHRQILSLVPRPIRLHPHNVTKEQHRYELFL